MFTFGDVLDNRGTLTFELLNDYRPKCTLQYSRRSHHAGIKLLCWRSVIFCIKVMLIYPYIQCPTPGLTQKSNQISSQKIRGIDT